MLAGGDSQVIPIKVMRSLLVTHPVALGIPKRSGIEANHAKSGSREALQEHTAACPYAYDDVIHLFRFRETMHRRLDPLNGAEHVRLPVRSLELPKNR